MKKLNIQLSRHFTFIFTALFLSILFCFQGYAQKKARKPKNRIKINGVVKDARTKEVIPFVNMMIKGKMTGTTTDLDGNFLLTNLSTKDTILVSAIGYDKRELIVKYMFGKYIGKKFIIKLTPDVTELSEVKILPRENPAFRIVRNISDNRSKNNPDRFESAEYNTYTKMTATLTNLSKIIRKNPLFKNHPGVFIQSKDSTKSDQLPILFMERITHDVKQKNPYIDYSKELDQKKRAIGFLEEADISGYAEQMTARVNFYDRFIELFGKSFASPVRKRGLMYYRYLITDSLFTDDGWEYTVSFRPKNKLEALFTGHFKVREDSWALMEIEAKLPDEAQINFVNKLQFKQKFQFINDSTLFWKNNVIEADFEFLDEEKNFLAPKEKVHLKQLSDYSNVKIHYNKLNPGEAGNDFKTVKAVPHKTDISFDHFRPEELDEVELQVTEALDSLNNHWAVKLGDAITKMVVTGYVEGKYVDYGPYTDWLMKNKVEGLRINANVRTSEGLIKNTELTGQVGYGFKDNDFKYTFGAKYRTSKDHWRFLTFKYRDDFSKVGDNGSIKMLRENTENTGEQSLLYSLIARKDIDKLVRDQSVSVGLIHEWKEGVTSTLDLSHHKVYSGMYIPFEQNGVPVSYYKNNEVSLTTRFSWDEKLDQTYFRRYYVGSLYPIINVKLTAGNYDIDSDKGNYYKVRATWKHKFNIGLTKLKYVAEAGYQFGKVPFTLLEVHRANQTYGLARYNYNTMNDMEFASTQFASLFLDYNLNGLVFKHIPLIKRWDWRESFSAKILQGRLDKNQIVGLDMPTYMHSLDNKPFIEFGAGISNIFQFLRIETIYRATHQLEVSKDNFGFRFRAEITF
ncbi:DUF5686 and carboxypeptidase regulatory-like domain-containing protein [Halosquirtibacter laminarini]|uniref:DUF5686 and carboxypeptidase regulatory-like domain-containing protein n=1 Tax=Halosquirtibacter laminarini TaxID=3374600 RepID=A0AC61NMS7_9BACT|nr:DUF5686 and carboxypeptidase regulatory-like domain-containing protein [Prolixibacteraceae bacterium]